MKMTELVGRYIIEIWKLDSREIKILMFYLNQRDILDLSPLVVLDFNMFINIDNNNFLIKSINKNGIVRE